MPCSVTESQIAHSVVLAAVILIHFKAAKSQDRGAAIAITCLTSVCDVNAGSQKKEYRYIRATYQDFEIIVTQNLTKIIENKTKTKQKQKQKQNKTMMSREN